MLAFGGIAAAGLAFGFLRGKEREKAKDKPTTVATVKKQVLLSSDEVVADEYPVAHIKERFRDLPTFENPILARSRTGSQCNSDVHTSNFVGPDEWFLTTQSMGAPTYAKRKHLRKCLAAGPTDEIYWEPKKVTAAIVTCGGLCPGLNTVVRELVMTLHYVYGVSKIYGIKNGYRGFYSEEPLPLTPGEVSHVHRFGGTFLGSSRGGFDLDKIIGAIRRLGINQVYVIGGDGTHRGAEALLKGALQQDIPLAVVAIPKTIDNDIPSIDKSFGFDTAVQEAVHPITCAHTEALAAPNGVGLVKLMGRNAGFIAMNASLASRDVNVCLIPEEKFDVEAVCQFLEWRLDRRGHAVVVVAEGCEVPPVDAEGKETVLGKDESGNVKLADVGALLKDHLNKYFKSKKKPINVKLIDPTYMIRSTPANASDSLLCANLAANAVHGAMAGRTGFTVGQVDGRFAWLPLSAVTQAKPRRVDTCGDSYSRLLLSTGQPTLQLGQKLEAFAAHH